MKIERTQIQRLRIAEADRLDPVTVYMEDYEPGKGKIIIECYGKSWSSFWGSMASNTIAEFLCCCDEHYLAKNLSSIDADVIDFDSLDKLLDMECTEDLIKFDYQLVADAVKRKTGYDMHDFRMPMKPNPEYQYLCRIIRAVQEALETIRTDRKISIASGEDISDA